jgi:hypothetical protein
MKLRSDYKYIFSLKSYYFFIIYFILFIKKKKYVLSLCIFIKVIDEAQILKRIQKHALYAAACYTSEVQIR